MNKLSLVLICTFLFVSGCSVLKPTTPSRKFTGAGLVPQYGLFELTLLSDEKVANPFWDTQIEAIFTSPGGKAIAVDGFYFGGNQWHVRFVPAEQGAWTYSALLTTPSGAKSTTGAFNCSGVEGHGFLHVSKRNAFRWEYADGTPFYPIGVQLQNPLHPDFDGPVPGSDADGSKGKWRSVSVETWISAFKGAINLTRTTLDVSTHKKPLIRLLDPDGALDVYNTGMAAGLDDVLAKQRKAGMSELLDFVDDESLWGSEQTVFGDTRDLTEFKSIHAKNLPFQEKYFRYVVARFACYVDVWELFNEDPYAPDDYLARLAEVVSKADPYHHPVTTNYARPRAAWNPIITFHEYMGMPDTDVDAYLSQQFAAYKAYGKLVQNTEFGNQGRLPNFDPVKWRIAVWTAFMNECQLVFWSHSGLKSSSAPVGENSNAYLGPDSRQSFRVLNDFTRNLPIDMRPVQVGYLKHTEARAYGLCNGRVGALYFHHIADHKTTLKLPYQLIMQTGPGKWQLSWISPDDGHELGKYVINCQQQFIEFDVPPTMIDLACRFDRLGLPEAKSIPTTAPKIIKE